MSEITVRPMQAGDEYFVSTCSHVNESAEVDASGRRRLAWLKARHDRGLRTLVALDGVRHVGFVYVMPADASPWGTLGEHLAVVPCVWVLPKEQKHGAGRALMAAAEAEARRQGLLGICTLGQAGDFWFMPAKFFEHLGWETVAERGKGRLLWKRFEEAAAPPEMPPERSWRFEPTPGRVAVDLFFNTFCATSDIEAERVREVVAELPPDQVVLREHPVDDRAGFLATGIGRGIFVNGQEIGWGYEAPKDGVREAILKAMGGA